VTLRRVDETSKSVRILVVDDYEPWRDFIVNTLKKEPGLEVIGQVSDGSTAVQQAHQLKPDLILLDIGLPTLNGIQAATRIRESSPSSKILFISENRYVDIVESALSTGAGGYVIKSDAAGELVPAIKAVLEGKRFLSASLTGHFLVASSLVTTQNLPWLVGLISGIC
jgi:DNA-binding NarL/FixJ family response regulator